MKLIKKVLLILTVSVILFSCNNSNYYEKPILEWINTNANDASSYEPIEFKIIKDYNDIEKIQLQVASYKNVFRRKIDLLPYLIKELSNDIGTDSVLLKQIIDIKTQLSSINLNSNVDLNKIDKLNIKLDSLLNKIFKSKGNSSNQNLIMNISQIEGTIEEI